MRGGGIPLGKTDRQDFSYCLPMEQPIFVWFKAKSGGLRRPMSDQEQHGSHPWPSDYRPLTDQCQGSLGKLRNPYLAAFCFNHR